jgi:flagellar basal-body rod protein FlgB
MTLFDVTQLSLESAIRGSAMRQTTLAANVANANTPGYVRQDVDFHGAPKAAMDSGDVENANLAKNGLEYEALVSVASARMAILKSAMGVQ